MLFGRGTTLFAQRLDLNRLELTGEPVRVVDGLGLNPNSMANYAFSVSDDGVLAYSSGSGIVPEMQVVSFDRTGKSSAPLAALASSTASARRQTDSGSRPSAASWKPTP